MCIIIVNPHDAQEVSEETLEHCSMQNPDGMGIAYASKGKIHIWKGTPNHIKKLQKHYRRARKMGATSIIHFRLATHGTVQQKTCHPFALGKDLAFAHNGIFSNLGKFTSDDVSDTMVFAQAILSRFSAAELRDEQTSAVLESICGHGNKLAFLHNTGWYHIINEDAGEWQDGTWYSNSGHRIFKGRTLANWNEDWSNDPWDDIDAKIDKAWESGTKIHAGYLAPPSVVYASFFHALAATCQKANVRVKDSKVHHWYEAMSKTVCLTCGERDLCKCEHPYRKRSWMGGTWDNIECCVNCLHAFFVEEPEKIEVLYTTWDEPSNCECCGKLLNQTQLAGQSLILGQTIARDMQDRNRKLKKEEDSKVGPA